LKTIFSLILMVAIFIGVELIINNSGALDFSFCNFLLALAGTSGSLMCLVIWRSANGGAMVVTNISACLAPLVGSGILGGYYALLEPSIFNQMLTGLYLTLVFGMLFFVVPAIGTTFLVAAIIRLKRARTRKGK